MFRTIPTWLTNSLSLLDSPELYLLHIWTTSKSQKHQEPVHPGPPQHTHSSNPAQPPSLCLHLLLSPKTGLLRVVPLRSQGNRMTSTARMFVNLCCVSLQDNTSHASSDHMRRIATHVPKMVPACFEST